MPNGRFDTRDITRLKELGDLIKSEFAEDKKMPYTIEREDLSSTQCRFTLKFPEWKHIRYVVLREDIAKYGQRVESFQIAYKIGDEQFYTGFSIGHKQICKLRDFYLNQIVITVTAARDRVELGDIDIYTCVVDE